MSLPDEPVYPACAGIHLARVILSISRRSLPRMRGDPPHGDKRTVDVS